MNKVGIYKCGSYQDKEIANVINQCLNVFVKQNQLLKMPSRIVLKANLVKNARPDEAATTNPAVLKAMITYFQKLNCHVIVGDCPGAPLGFNKKTLDSVYHATGMLDLAKETGCELNYDTSKRVVAFRDGKVMKEILAANFILNADYVISVAKLKTHTMMSYSGAVKNLFGVVPGRKKMKYHFLMNNADEFAELMVDLCEFVKPVLSIVDGVEGMEGNGPTAGEKTYPGVIMASLDPYLLDMAAVQLIGLDPEKIPSIQAAVGRGLVRYTDLKEMKLIGNSPEELAVKPFKKAVIVDQYTIPVIKYESCKACGMCIEVCPMKTIQMVNNRPRIEDEKCIRCFCCHELCPEKAVDIERMVYL